MKSNKKKKKRIDISVYFVSYDRGGKAERRTRINREGKEGRKLSRCLRAAGVANPPLKELRDNIGVRILSIRRNLTVLVF